MTRLRFAYADPPYVGQFTGAKPESFASWLAVLLGWKVGDDLVDLFPGSGAVGEWYDRLRLDL